MSLQVALQREREELTARLRQIDEVLGQSSGAPAQGATGRRGRRGNPMPLRDAVLHVTSGRSLTKQEIYDAVLRLGYRFTGKDPLNVLGVVLYGKNPRFRNDGGRFSPVPGSANSVTPGKKRGMSAAGRARIAAAQRARWAKERGNTVSTPRAGKRRMSAEGRARIAAAAKARWARERAAKAG